MLGRWDAWRRLDSGHGHRRWLAAEADGELELGDLGCHLAALIVAVDVDQDGAAERDQADQRGEQRDDAIHHTHPVIGVQPGPSAVLPNTYSPLHAATLGGVPVASNRSEPCFRFCQNCSQLLPASASSAVSVSWNGK